MSRVSLNIVEDTIYAKGKIYCLKSHNLTKIYIGSTIVSLAKRLSKHIEDYLTEKNCASAYFIEAGDYWIELLEKYPCNSKLELRKREQEWLDHYSDDCVNHLRAYTSEEDRNNYLYDYRRKPEVREKLNAYKRERVNCPYCQKELSRNALKRHINSFH